MSTIVLRQDRLALEVTWPTKCCWFCLIQTLTGMCVVDLFRLYRNKDQSYLEWDIIKFADHMTANLFKVTERSATLSIKNQERKSLEPISDKYGNRNRTPTKKKQQRNDQILGKYLLNPASFAKSTRVQCPTTALRGGALSVECLFA